MVSFEYKHDSKTNKTYAIFEITSILNQVILLIALKIVNDALTLTSSSVLNVIFKCIYHLIQSQTSRYKLYLFNLILLNINSIYSI